MSRTSRLLGYHYLVKHFRLVREDVPGEPIYTYHPEGDYPRGKKWYTIRQMDGRWWFTHQYIPHGTRTLMGAVEMIEALRTKDKEQFNG